MHVLHDICNHLDHSNIWSEKEFGDAQTVVKDLVSFVLSNFKLEFDDEGRAVLPEQLQLSLQATAQMSNIFEFCRDVVEEHVAELEKIFVKLVLHMQPEGSRLYHLMLTSGFKNFGKITKEDHQTIRKFVELVCSDDLGEQQLGTRILILLNDKQDDKALITTIILGFQDLGTVDKFCCELVRMMDLDQSDAFRFVVSMIECDEGKRFADVFASAKGPTLALAMIQWLDASDSNSQLSALSILNKVVLHSKKFADACKLVNLPLVERLLMLLSRYDWEQQQQQQQQLIASCIASLTRFVSGFGELMVDEIMKAQPKVLKTLCNLLNVDSDNENARICGCIAIACLVSADARLAAHAQTQRLDIITTLHSSAMTEACNRNAELEYWRSRALNALEIIEAPGYEALMKMIIFGGDYGNETEIEQVILNLGELAADPSLAIRLHGFMLQLEGDMLLRTLWVAAHLLVRVAWFGENLVTADRDDDWMKKLCTLMTADETDMNSRRDMELKGNVAWILGSICEAIDGYMIALAPVITQDNRFVTNLCKLLRTEDDIRLHFYALRALYVMTSKGGNTFQFLLASTVPDLPKLLIACIQTAQGPSTTTTTTSTPPTTKAATVVSSFISAGGSQHLSFGIKDMSKYYAACVLGSLSEKVVDFTSSIRNCYSIQALVTVVCDLLTNPNFLVRGEGASVIAAWSSIPFFGKCIVSDAAAAVAVESNLRLLLADPYDDTKTKALSAIVALLDSTAEFGHLLVENTANKEDLCRKLGKLITSISTVSGKINTLTILSRLAAIYEDFATMLVTTNPAISTKLYTLLKRSHDHRIIANVVALIGSLVWHVPGFGVALLEAHPEVTTHLCSLLTEPNVNTKANVANAIAIMTRKIPEFGSLVVTIHPYLPSSLMDLLKSDSDEVKNTAAMTISILTRHVPEFAENLLASKSSHDVADALVKMRKTSYGAKYWANAALLDLLPYFSRKIKTQLELHKHVLVRNYCDEQYDILKTYSRRHYHRPPCTVGPPITTRLAYTTLDQCRKNLRRRAHGQACIIS